MPQSIIVIGAGVIGLSTALELQARHPSHPITIVSRELPTHMAVDPSINQRPSADYASAWAGAHYRVLQPPTTPQTREERWARLTSRKMSAVASRHPSAGVQIMPGVEHFENPPPSYSSLKSGDPFASDDESDTSLRILDPSSLPAGVKLGISYTSYSINVVTYCQRLLTKFISQGGQVVQKTLPNATAAFTFNTHQRNSASPPIVVNCSGRNFDLDPKVNIIRGQTVLVKNKYHQTITRQNADGTWAFLIPRPGAGTIVGGTKEVGDWNDVPVKATSEALLKAAVRCFPDFVDGVSKFEVVQENVGRRPAREGGARVEVERLGEGKVVVHGYGLGGSGYELSWGVAGDVADLVDGVLRKEKGLSKL